MKCTQCSGDDWYVENNVVYCKACHTPPNTIHLGKTVIRTSDSTLDRSDLKHHGYVSYMEYLALRNDPEKLKQRARENKRRDDELQEMFMASDICPHCGQDL